MASLPKAPAESTDDTALLVLARQLRAAAVAAGRLDVAAEADEAIALLTGTDKPTTDAPDTVIRIMNGLGF